MGYENLKKKALGLPYLPGVYLMKDKDDKVIYVGKAKKLKNRVSQYFQDTASHNYKTRLMVSKVHHFDVIVCNSEFEALVLECAQIKQYKPKYNILLKDDKGYPYIRISTKDAYPTMTMVGKISDDGAQYFGPFGSRSATKDLLDAIVGALKLPSCGKKFPRDIGKDRPCLNHHMNQCLGWCTGRYAQAEYAQAVEQAKKILSGKHKDVLSQLEEQMLQAAENLQFEIAASIRDRMKAIELLGTKQLVATGKFSDLDVIGFAQTETKACFAVLHFDDGKLVDKDYEILDATEDPVGDVSALLKQYYLAKDFAPKRVLLPFVVNDADLFAQLMAEKTGYTTRFLVPQRGENKQLVEMAQKNALEEAERVTDKEERISKTVTLLGKMLQIQTPKRIESFDISNISGTDIVSSMVVFCDGKPKKSEYKHFKIEGLGNQDDYASMEQTVRRRFNRLKMGDSAFDQMPDLLLVDGGVNHAAIAVRVLIELGLNIPIFGMVKDDRHRTRALITPEGAEIRIDNQPAVFALIGNIQEETHRFAITYHRKLRSNRLRYSELDKISGIGPTRKQQLLRRFKSIAAIAGAELSELEQILPKDAAQSVYTYFENKRNEE